MKKGILMVAAGVYFLSTVFFCGKTLPEGAAESAGHDNPVMVRLDEESLGAMCLSAVYPGLTLSADNHVQEETLTQAGTENDQIQIITGEYREEPEPVVFGDEPAVLIVHTHATESYLPASEGNYHTKEKENSVRQVGEALARTLEENGIAAVHDQTLHDSPSYNQSYSRSGETIEKLLKEYPSIVCVIDLHRDAVASESAAATLSSGGRTCARYSYVVSTAVETYKSNLAFIKNMNRTAETDFGGFTGKILERGYRYNQNLSSKYMLLEIGYNRNQIEEAVNTAQVFGQILASTLKAGY